MVLNDREIISKVSAAKIERSFDLKRQLQNIEKIFARVFPRKPARRTPKPHPASSRKKRD
jgi:hypothetical protein